LFYPEGPIAEPQSFIFEVKPPEPNPDSGS
jgi:hypothetical protein